jgi:hypothetical protein
MIYTYIHRRVKNSISLILDLYSFCLAEREEYKEMVKMRGMKTKELDDNF